MARLLVSGRPTQAVRGWWRTWFAILASATTTLLLVLNPGSAGAATTVPVGTQLKAVLEDLGGAAGLGPLGQPLPFMGSTPAQLIGLDQLLDDLAGELNNNSLDADALEGMEGTYGGITVDVTGPGGADLPTVNTSVGDTDITDVIFKITATKTIAVPVSYVDDLVDLSGGGTGVVNLAFTLETSMLHFQHDASITDPALVDQSFWLRTLPTTPVPAGEQAAPSLTLSIDADAADVANFSESIGIADVDVDGSFSLHAAIAATLADPDTPSDDKITVDELLNTPVDELATVGFAATPETPDLSFSLGATVTGLTGGDTPVASITASDTDLTAAPGPEVTPQLGDLSDFLNMTPSDLIGSIDRLATWLGNVANAGNLDPQIPFLGGTFSDVVDMTERLSDLSASLRWASDQAGTVLDDTGLPKFATLDGFVDLLGADFPIAPSYSATNHRLSFDLAVDDSFTKGIPLGFGNLDILQGIRVTSSGSANVAAGYEAGLGVALDLTPLDKESAESGPLSCVDGLDNDGNGDIDAADPECAGIPTLDQRVLLDVGTAAGNPEISATTEINASGINATAQVGLLGVGITGGTVTFDDGAGDPATIEVDVYETGAGADGLLTISELVNALGGTGNGEVDATIDAHLASTLPVSANIGATSLGGGSIVATADVAGDFTDPGSLLADLDVDASSLQTAALYDFSPCDNATDDDGDGVVNDGCPAAGSPDAVSDPESQSTAMFQAVIDMIRALADQVDGLAEEDFGGSALNTDLPVIGRSVAELADLATPLLDLADRLSTPSEASIENGCTGAADDDHDGAVNDGCPTEPDGGGTPAPAPEVGEGCANATDDDGDGAVNDGCLPVSPSLQTLTAYLQGLLTDEINEALAGIKSTKVGTPDPSLTVAVTLGYDQGTRSLDLTTEIDSTVRAETAFNLELGGSLAGYDIVGLDATGDLAVDVVTDVTLGFGVDLDDFRPYLLGSTDASITAQAAGEALELAASLGPITVQLGNNDPQPEVTADGECDDGTSADDDDDGFANDGCGIKLNPEPSAVCGNGLDEDSDGVADDGCSEAPPAASGDSEADLTDACGNGVDNDDDGIADDGCPTAPLVAGPGPAATDGEDELTDACVRGDTVDDDGDGLVNDGCPAQGNPGLAYLGAGFSIVETGGDTDRHFFAPEAGEDPIAFESGNDPDPALGGVHPDQCTDDLVPGGSTAVACARLPIYADLGDGLAFLSPLTMTWDSFGSTPTINVDEQALLDAIEQQALDLLLMKSGLGKWIDRLEALLRDGLFGIDLPLIGDALDDAADFVASLRDASNLTSTLEGALNGQLASNPLAGLATAGAVDTAVDSLAASIDGALSDAVQPAGTSVTGEVLCDKGGPTAQPCDGSEPATDVEDVVFTVPLGQTAEESTQDFDIGVPGLGIASEEGIAVEGSWAVTLKLGVSRTDGFFLDTSAADELSVSAGIDLPDSGMAATLGFLKVNIYDGGPTTDCSADPNVDPVTGSCDVDGGTHLPTSTFGPSFTIDLKGAGDDRLTLADLTKSPSFGDLFTYDMTVAADLNLHLVTEIAGTDGQFPRLFADLTLDWGFTATNSDDPDDLRDPAELNVDLSNVALDAGSFLRDFLGPIVENIQVFTEPLQPVIDQLNAPIPILSDFAGQPVTLLDLIITFGASQDIELGLIEDIVKFIDFINGLNAPSGSNLFVVPISGSGAFDLGSSTLLSGPLDQSQARSVFDPADLAAADSASLLDEIAAKTPGEASSSEIKEPKGLHDIGLFFPFIEQPSQLMGLLFGQDVDLVIWQPRELTASFSYSQKFGPIWTVPPVFLEVGGSAGVTGRFGIGYDTQGLREVLFEGADAGNLLHGLFLLDRRLNDDGSFQTEDPAEIELFGELFANAQVSVLIFSAGAQGSVYTKLGLNLNDPNNDGKLKWAEAADTLRATGNPICLFTFEGRFGVLISVFAEVDLFFWSQRWTKTLADIILYEFEVNCADPVEPVLASPDEGMDLDALARPDGSTGGDVFGPGTERVLKLHLGALRASRGANSVGIDEKEEKFVVNKEKDGSITVTALGVSQNYPPPAAGPWEAVFVDGGTDGADGGDVITFNDNVVKGENQPVTNGGADTANRCGEGEAQDDDGDGRVNDGCPTQPEGGDKESGDECLNATDDDGDGFVNDGCPAVETSVPFDINTWIEGAGGDDQITAGHGINVVFGSGGADTITTKESRDWVAGDEGNDQISLGNDPNTGGQEDYGNGGSGDDVVDGGPGRDILIGGGNDDTLIGGLTIPAQPGNPAQLKAPIPEQPDGVDRLEGGTGQDDLDGGPAGDVLIGGADPDRLTGGPGADTLWGDGENDPASIADDPCAGFPSGFDDVLVGGEDADTIHAGAGDDIVVGGSLIPGRTDVGDTLLAGDPGCDLVIGDNAQFTDDTNPRAFVLIDPDTGGGDVMAGGSGADHLHGSIGGDTMAGDDDSDLLIGGAGNDTIDGGNDRDIAHGDGGGVTPAAFATAGDDIVIGGNGNDDLFGEGGADTMLGDVGSVSGAGVVTLTSGDGTDLMYGGGDPDRMYGQGGVDTMFGDGAKDHMLGNDGADLMRGGTDEDEMFGNDGGDTMWGDAGPDRMVGGSNGESAPDDGTDTMYGGSGTDVMLGDNGTITAGPAFAETLMSDGTPSQLANLEGDADVMYGEAQEDRMYGELGNDRMRGGSGDDYLEGNANGPGPIAPAVLDCTIATPLGDLLLGEADQDDLIGGGDDVGYADGADCMFGDGSIDVMAGDNASITRPGGTDAYDGAVKRTVDLLDLFTAPTGIAGADVMHGGDAADRMFGGGADETVMHGDGGDDYLEGNGGGDTVYGDAGQDDVIGGTSQNDAAGSDFTGRHVAPGGNPPAGPVGGTVPDGADTIYGDDGAGGTAADHDLIAGDNASLIRPVDGSDQWFLDDLDTGRGVIDVARRVLQLFDVATASTPTADAGGRSGGDLLHGEDGHDVVYGQGGGDTIRGGPSDDYLEGGNGSDDIQGNDGQDDVVGGTGRTRTDDPSTAVDGRLDVGDTLYGGNGDPSLGNDTSDDDDYDVVMGDNSTVFRSATGALGAPWTHYDHAGTGVLVVQRYLRLYDVATTTYTPPAGSSGPDTLYGEDDDDLMYGQGADDDMFGGGDDYMEGNAAADHMEGQDDQDDMIGGTGVINDDPPTGTNGRLDGGDEMLGGDHADFQLGDNGSIVRPLDEDDHWTYVTEYNPTTVRRNGGAGTTTPRRFDVAGPAGTSGGDTMDGNQGDDYQWGQDGDDLMHGNEDNDDMYGELGADQMFGDAGQDAMVGDRGMIVDTRLDDDSKRVAYDTQGPAFFEYVGLVQGQLDRRVTLTDDGDGAPRPAMGIDTGGGDRMRGGPGHDSMHGAFGDDLMNGDSGGDWMFGADGADVMWGGKGVDDTSPEDTPTQAEVDAEPGVLRHNLRGEGDRFVDYLFAGHGGQPPSGNITQQVLKADIMDYLPRAADPSNGFTGDPAAWFDMTDTEPGDDLDLAQYHQGIDWMYGGYDRDVMEGDVGKNGPDFGDRLMDWTGAFNLYTRCNASYGDDGDIRQHSPSMQGFLQTLAYGSGAGLTPDEVLTAGTSAFRELGLVYPGDKGNSGKAFPTTPGHYNAIDCDPGT